jgi:hypothetical protein
LPFLGYADNIAVTRLLLFACLSAWGQSAMPEWLASFPKTQAPPASGADGSSIYTALAPPADVIAHYQEKMRAAGVGFKVQSDGIGVSIVASEGRGSAVVRIRDDGGQSSVRVLYTLKPPETAPTPPPATISTAVITVPAQPAFPGGRRAPTSPWTREPYTWILQTAALPGSSPIRYSAIVYDAPTDGGGKQPLALPAGATIIDVFNDKCAISFVDQAGHTLTFQNAKQAIGKVLGPGWWSMYPISCGGQSVYLR